MSAIPFAVYTACCLLVLAAQLVFALREWRSLIHHEPMFVDQLYVRVERYFGVAFRQKLETWLRLTPSTIAPGVAVIDKDREQIWVHEALSIAAGDRLDYIIVADTLQTGYGCHLLREVYTRKDCHIGDASLVQAVAADGAIRLGRGTHVVRWIDAAGDLVVEPQCLVKGRATSATRLVIHAGARVNSAHAPIIVTVNGRSHDSHEPAPDDATSGIVLNSDDEVWSAIGATGTRRRIAADCLSYDGNLILPTVTIASSLVVRGNLMLGPHSVVERDVKATGSIHIGAQSVCQGNLVAGGDVYLASNVAFRGVIFAEGSIHIGSGSTGVKPDPGVAVYGAKTVVLQPGVTIHGKVSSGDHVIVTSD